MDAFEQLVAELLFAEGYWVETSFKVELTKEEKARIGRISSPRWEIDVVAYKASINELLAVECKSFLDSTGVQFAELQDGHASTRYKLFREPLSRDVILNRLRLQMIESGRCRESMSVRLAMAAGNIKRGDASRVEAHIVENGWVFFGPEWLRERLRRRSLDGYSNQISSVVAKLLLRERRGERARATKTDRGDTRLISLLVDSNPKKMGSQARERFERYFELTENTVSEALALGIRRDDLLNDVNKGFIKLSNILPVNRAGFAGGIGF